MFEDWAEHVRHYRADLFYDLLSLVDVARQLDEADKKEKVQNGEWVPLCLMGIRDLGVDHESFVECRMADWAKTYSGVYKVEISRNQEFTGTTIYELRLMKAVKVAKAVKGAKKK